MADYTILIIDYNPRSIEALKTPLEQAGYRVEVAHDGVSGIREFERIEPDLTMVEAMLPKRHGFEVCQELKSTGHGRKSPVMIVTGVYRGHKYRNQARHQYGCDRYLEKPLTDAQLLAAVRELLPGRSVEAPANPAIEAAPTGRAGAPAPRRAVSTPEPPPAAAPDPHRRVPSIAADGSVVKPARSAGGAHDAVQARSEGSKPGDVPPDYDDAELEIINQLDNLFADDGASSAPAEGRGGSGDPAKV
jgi:CheY-like chemotaxis protein